jgi:hypothetical protein
MSIKLVVALTGIPEAIAAVAAADCLFILFPHSRVSYVYF